MDILTRKHCIAHFSGKTSSLVVIILAGLVLGFAAEAYNVYRISSDNRLVLNPEAIVVADKTSPQAVFAKAWLMEKDGDYQTALQLYNSLEHRTDGALLEMVHYNMGTLYLKQAAKHWNTKGVWAYTQVNTLTHLAEQSFKTVLRENSENWNARYNLEYALRIKPPPKIVDKADWTGRRSSVHSIYPGIPGGGP